MQKIGRDDLIEDVKYGRMSPDEAEAGAIKLGLKPFASTPDPQKYNPIGEVWWSISMTVAWIAWRSGREVLESYDPYRLQCWDWHYQEWQVPGGPIFKGHFLKQRQRATLSLLAFNERYDIANGSVRENSISVADAEARLWKALQDDQLRASGIPNNSDQRKPIPDYEWHDLKPVEENGRDGVRYDLLSPKGYNEVICRRQAVTALWPERRLSQAKIQLPPTVRPDGPGYFQLYCAVQWIATRGGVQDFDPTDNKIWQEAYDELTARIASGHIGVTGIQGGMREKIEGHIFASMRVDHPFLETPLDLILSNELYLSSYPYVDDEHWKNGFDDSLQSRDGVRWSKLMVLKSEVAQFWPFSAETPSAPPAFRTGAPGRPTPMHLVVAEHGHRLANGKAESSVVAESEQLVLWLKKNYPDIPALTAKTIRNKISAEHRRAQKRPK